MRKLFLVLTLAGVLAAPAVAAEAAEPVQDNAVTVEATRERGTKDPAREEERLMKEAKKVVREIFKAQRVAKKTERTVTSEKIAGLREQMANAGKGEKKGLRNEISDLRENKKFDTVDEFLDHLVLYYGNDSVKSEGYVVSVADTRKNLNAVITYDNKTRTLTVAKDDITITVTIDANGAYANGEVLYAKGSHGDKEEDAE